MSLKIIEKVNFYHGLRESEEFEKLYGKVMALRLRGYSNFHGEYCLPFGSDDIFSDYFVAFWEDEVIFAFKYSSIEQMNKFAGLENYFPFQDLLDQENTSKLKNMISSHSTLYLSGFTHEVPKSLGKGLANSLLAYSFVKLSESHHLLLSTNLKAKLDIKLNRLGFLNLDLPNIFHPELFNNRAIIQLLKSPSTEAVDLAAEIEHLVGEEAKVAA